MSRPIRVVIDTNLVLSALLFSRGRMEALRFAWQSGILCPLLSAATAEELVAVLAYPKFKLAPPDRDELLADYLPYCTVIRLPKAVPRLPVRRDPADLPFLALAVSGKAKCLVTGDRDLLAVQGRLAFRILPPAVLLSELP